MNFAKKEYLPFICINFQEKLYIYARKKFFRHATQPVVNHGNPASIQSIDATGNFAVVKTGPGFAAAIASMIDVSVMHPDIMGTIAGDDTVLVIMRKPEAIDVLLEGMEKMLPGCSIKYQGA